MKVMRDDNDGRIVEVQGDAPAPDGFTILDLISRAAVVAMLKAKADYYDHEARIETDVSLRAMFFARSATIESCILMIEEMKS